MNRIPDEFSKGIISIGGATYWFTNTCKYSSQPDLAITTGFGLVLNMHGLSFPSTDQFGKRASDIRFVMLSKLILI